jgi:hypothetical protein
VSGLHAVADMAAAQIQQLRTQFVESAYNSTEPLAEADNSSS